MVYNFGSFLLIFQGFDGYVRFMIALLTEFYSTIDLCKQSMVFSHADVIAWMVNGTPLPDQDIPCFNHLASI